MSAFMCHPDTIRRISKALASYFRTLENPYLIPKDVLYLGERPSEEECFDALVKFNESALLEKYDDAEDMFWKNKLECHYKEPEKAIEETEKSFFPNSLDRVDDILLFQNLECYIYQISEGSLIDSELYKTLLKFQDVVARRIVVSERAYELISIGKKAWR